MKNIVKKFIIIIICFSSTLLNKVAAQETSPQQRNGYRIHSMYGDIGISIPNAELKKYVPAGLALDFGSLFMFHKIGFANGLVNVGLKAEWLNIETNIPYGDLNQDEPQYSFAIAGNYGPMATFNPKGAMYIDVYYTPGWGFRMFPNIQTASTDDINPDQPLIQLSQAIGAHFRYKALKLGLGLHVMNNKKFRNGAFINPIRTVQLSVGICGWKNK